MKALMVGDDVVLIDGDKNRFTADVWPTIHAADRVWVTIDGAHRRRDWRDHREPIHESIALTDLSSLLSRLEPGPQSENHLKQLWHAERNLPFPWFVRRNSQPRCHNPHLPHRLCRDAPDRCSEPPPSPVWRVYFVRAETGQIKIGRSIDPLGRLGELQTGSPNALKLIAHVEEAGDITERTLHRRFEESRVSGEWFLPSDELLELIGKVRR